MLVGSCILELSIRIFTLATIYYSTRSHREDRGFVPAKPLAEY